MPNSAAVGGCGEAALIERLRRRLPPAPSWMIVGIGDDAAVVAPARNRLEVLTVDALVEGVHFERRFTPPDAIGYRALAVNLSDLAAMGAEPRLALVSLALPPDLPLDDYDALVEGLVKLAALHELHVAGGNITRSPGPLVVDITVVGSVKPRRAITRAGARAGDRLYVSGSLGAATAGLEMLQAGIPRTDGPAGRYLYPQPRVRLASLLARNRAVSAGLDLSDGLADGVRRIAAAGGLGAIIDASCLPIDPDARRWFQSRGEDPIARTVSGGDDYELLVAVRPKCLGRLAAARRHGDVPLTEIGVCTEAPQLVLRQPSPAGSHDTALPGAEFAHFA
jgi:thiamine-monophosphate kinase